VEILININDAIKALERRYVHRGEFFFIKKIDSLIAKLEILGDIKPWIFYARNECLICYIDFKSEEYSRIIEEAEFLDEEKLYFLYKILHELHEFSNKVDIKISVHSGPENLNQWKQKVYFHNLLNSSKSINLTKTEQIKNCDRLGKEVDYHNKIDMHNSTKSFSAHLLDVKQYESFRPNINSILQYKIKQIKKNQVKKILCPVCNDAKTLYWNNKDQIFKSSSKKITLVCDHIGTNFYDRFPVTIDLKEYKKQLSGIDEVDWVIYNYPQLFKLFMDSIYEEMHSDNVV